jgi:hypothetical protein
MRATTSKILLVKGAVCSPCRAEAAMGYGETAPRFDRTPQSFDSRGPFGFESSPSWLLARRMILIIANTLPVLHVGPF